MQLPLGAEAELIGEDDVEEAPGFGADEGYRIGQDDEEFHDYAGLELKDDHANRHPALFAGMTRT